MTYDEAAAILGPELTAELTAQPATPLTDEQLQLLARLLGPVEAESRNVA